MSNGSSGYKVDPAAVRQQINHFGDLISELQQSIQRMNNIQEELLSDSLWQGPNKNSFRSNFISYLNIITQVLRNSNDSHNGLNEIINTYLNAEKG